VPDYLTLIKELLRVLKPGGVLYIDHEVGNSYWQSNNVYNEFSKKMKQIQGFPWKKLFSIEHYINRIKRLFNPRFQAEGDIHVFPDDHIEWDKIVEIIKSQGEILLEEDYLVFRSDYDLEVYNAYKDKCSDMHLLMARKL
jgi:SAM-dependent methyltransferase